MMATGIGWRHAHYGELLQAWPVLDFIEGHSENFFGEGGAALDLLDQARRHYAVSLHGVGRALGSAAGIDDWHLGQLERLVRRIEPVRVSDHAWQIYRHALQRFGDVPSLIEWDTAIPPLAVLLEEARHARSLAPSAQLELVP